MFVRNMYSIHCDKKSPIHPGRECLYLYMILSTCMYVCEWRQILQAGERDMHTDALNVHETHGGCRQMPRPLATPTCHAHSYLHCAPRSLKCSSFCQFVRLYPPCTLSVLCPRIREESICNRRLYQQRQLHLSSTPSWPSVYKPNRAHVSQAWWCPLQGNWRIA